MDDVLAAAKLGASDMEHEGTEAYRLGRRGGRRAGALEDIGDPQRQLARLGADPGRIATLVYKMRPETTLKLSGLALATMRVEMEGRLAWAKVTRRMLREAGAVLFSKCWEATE